jgi:hypothetical protein
MNKNWISLLNAVNAHDELLRLSECFVELANEVNRGRELNEEEEEAYELAQEISDMNVYVDWYLIKDSLRESTKITDEDWDKVHKIMSKGYTKKSVNEMNKIMEKAAKDEE